MSVKPLFTLLCLVLLNKLFCRNKIVINNKMTYLRLIFKIKASMVCLSILIYTGCWMLTKLWCPANHDIWGLNCDFCVEFLVDQWYRWDSQLGVNFEVNYQINVPKLRVKLKRSIYLVVKSIDFQSSDTFWWI